MVGKLRSTPKQAYSNAGLGGAVGILVVWILGLFGLQVPGEPAAAIGTVSTFIVNRLLSP